MVLLWFIRHGESEGNKEKRFQGQSHVPLSKKGKSQVIELTNHFKEKNIIFDRLYSSPIHRAFETAKIIQEEL